MAITSCELTKGLRQLLRDLHVPVDRSILLHCNSQATLHANLVFYKRTKHVKIIFHFVREAFQASFILYYLRNEL